MSATRKGEESVMSKLADDALDALGGLSREADELDLSELVGSLKDKKKMPKKEDMPARRNPVMQALMEGRPGAGQGKHKNPADFQRGHARRPKHRHRGLEAGISKFAESDSLRLFLRGLNWALRDRKFESVMKLKQFLDQYGVEQRGPGSWELVDPVGPKGGFRYPLSVSWSEGSMPGEIEGVTVTA